MTQSDSIHIFPVKFFHLLCRLFLRKELPPLNLGSTRAERGVYGEALAASYCQHELGYREIVRNWRCKQGEIDLIFRDGEVLVFIEVRARSAEALVSGFHSVNSRKKAILRRACQNYLSQLQNPPKHFRFDIMDVALSKDGKGDVRHYTNIPLFSKHYSPRNR